MVGHEHCVSDGLLARTSALIVAIMFTTQQGSIRSSTLAARSCGSDTQHCAHATLLLAHETLLWSASLALTLDSAARSRAPCAQFLLSASSGSQCGSAATVNTTEHTELIYEAYSVLRKFLSCSYGLHCLRSPDTCQSLGVPDPLRQLSSNHDLWASANKVS